MNGDSQAVVHNVTLTGLPRSGTTLTCHLLNKLPNVVALHEPMRVEKLGELPDREHVFDEINRFFAECRQSIAETGMVMSKHVNGEVPDNSVRGNVTESGLRKGEGVRGLIRIEKELPQDYILCLKHPVTFTALLPELRERFPVYAVVRNPLSVLSSWNSVQMPVGRGHAPGAEKLDADLRDALAARDDVMARQLYLIDWFFSRYRSTLAAEHIFRYEDIIASGGQALAPITAGASNLQEPLHEMNTNKVYKPETVEKLAKALLAGDGAYWHFYEKSDIERVRDAILE